MQRYQWAENIPGRGYHTASCGPGKGILSNILSKDIIRTGREYDADRGYHACVASAKRASSAVGSLREKIDALEPL